ncbi:MAG: Aspartate/glutamate/uridylate kinase [Olpidium bornovanus]|uniref:Aspartate/glutamate/uridylate kinase n=1 Tax=Olpidium bornovanus TaxID=278681 RepID=A0A8H7ZRI2_9FUNG|nr:MAG: Aspartate/glutamate/uridylate kinase [Olpidium bornovanus]
MIISVGEKLSCRLVAAVLADRGVLSEYVSLENIVQRSWDEEILDQSFYDYLSKEIGYKLEKCGENVPVVTGYFGNVPGSLLATVGRGYTDLAAALAAVGLGADELQVWKDVDGIFTADPRKVPRARLLPMVTPDEAAELTYYGSEVIHPFTMDQVIRAQIPIRIKNVQRPEGRGTVIFPDVSCAPRRASAAPLHGAAPAEEEEKQQRDAARERSRSPSSCNAPKKKHAAGAPASLSGTIPPKLRKLLSECGYSANLTRRLPTAVTVKEPVIVLNVHSNRKSVSHGFLANIFSLLDRHRLVVDMISTSEVHVSMVLGLRDTGAFGLENVLNELKSLGRVSADDRGGFAFLLNVLISRDRIVDVLKDLAILSVVGRHMSAQNTCRCPFGSRLLKRRYF